MAARPAGRARLPANCRRSDARHSRRRHHAARCASVPVGDPHDDRAHAADRGAHGPHRLPAHRSRRHHPVRRLRALSQGGPLGAHAADAPAHHQHAAQLVHALQEPRQLRRACPTTSSSCGSSGWSPTASARSAPSTGSTTSTTCWPRSTSRVASASKTFGALSYGLSPVHTDELYVRTARDLIKRGKVDAIWLKDAGGLLTVDRIRTWCRPSRR